MEVNSTTQDETRAEPVAEPATPLKRSRKRNITIVAIVSVLNIGLLVLLATQLLTPSPSATGSVDMSGPMVGKVAPDLTLLTINGAAGSTHKLSMAQFKGKPVVLNFWASWCEPCNAEAPFLQKNVAKLTAQGITFISIDAGESPSMVDAFNQKYGITYASVIDTTVTTTTTDYGVVSFPTTIFIDRNGVIRVMRSNTLDDASLKAALSKITA